MYRLTQEGKYYLQKGFPEKHLLQILKSGRKLLSETSLDRKEAAIYWARKKKWIRVDGNDAILTFFGRMALPFQKLDVEDALSDVEKRGACNERLAKELLSRKLIEEFGKDNLSWKLKNMFWKKGEFAEKKHDKSKNNGLADLKRKMYAQQETMEYMQSRIKILEKRLRNIEQNKG